jgi:hypothetical protein
MGAVEDTVGWVGVEDLVIGAVDWGVSTVAWAMLVRVVEVTTVAVVVVVLSIAYNQHYYLGWSECYEGRHGGLTWVCKKWMW